MSQWYVFCITELLSTCSARASSLEFETNTTNDRDPYTRRWNRIRILLHGNRPTDGGGVMILCSCSCSSSNSTVLCIYDICLLCVCLLVIETLAIVDVEIVSSFHKIHHNQCSHHYRHQTSSSHDEQLSINTKKRNENKKTSRNRTTDGTRNRNRNQRQTSYIERRAGVVRYVNRCVMSCLPENQLNFLPILQWMIWIHPIIHHTCTTT